MKGLPVHLLRRLTLAATVAVATVNVAAPFAFAQAIDPNAPPTTAGGPSPTALTSNDFADAGTRVAHGVQTAVTPWILVAIMVGITAILFARRSRLALLSGGMSAFGGVLAIYAPEWYLGMLLWIVHLFTGHA